MSNNTQWNNDNNNNSTDNNDPSYHLYSYLFHNQYTNSNIKLNIIHKSIKIFDVIISLLYIYYHIILLQLL